MASTNVPDLADVLVAVNRLRAERALDPLSEMPKGVPELSFCCPVANALKNGTGVRVYPPSRLGGEGSFFMGASWPGGVEHRLPQVLADFARAFDDGRYPDLVDPMYGNAPS